MESPKLYVEYRGPGGPEATQKENNDKALKLVLDINNIPNTWNNTWMLELCDEDESVIEIQRPSKDGNGSYETIYVSYDRWGYVIDTVDIIPEDRLSHCDQKSLKETLQIIKRWYNS